MSTPWKLAVTADYAEAERRIPTLIDLLSDPRELYRNLPDDYRKAFNDLCFDKLYIDADSPDTPTIARTDDSAAREPLQRYRKQLHAESPENTKEGRDSRHGPSSGAPCSNMTPTVELILAYLNTPPQVDGLFRRLLGPCSLDAEASCPSRRAGSVAEDCVENAADRIPRPLHRRLSADQRMTLVASFKSGVKQKDLAVQYGISTRSVKRLIRSPRRRNSHSLHTDVLTDPLRTVPGCGMGDERLAP